MADRFVLGLALEDALVPGFDSAIRPLDEQVAMFERHLIEEALTRSDGRAALASERLGLPRKTLYDKMKRLGISTDGFKVAAGG